MNPKSNTQAEKFIRAYIKARFEDTMVRQPDYGTERNKQYCQPYDGIVMLLRKEAYDFPETLRNDLYLIVNHPPFIKRIFAEYFHIIDDHIGCKPTGVPTTALAAAIDRRLMIDNILADLSND